MAPYNFNIFNISPVLSIGAQKHYKNRYFEACAKKRLQIAARNVFFRSWDDLLVKKRVSTSKMFDVDKWPILHRNLGKRVFLSGRGPNGDASAIYIYIYAYNLIRWAVFRLKKVKKQRES